MRSVSMTEPAVLVTEPAVLVTKPIGRLPLS